MRRKASALRATSSTLIVTFLLVGNPLGIAAQSQTDSPANSSPLTTVNRVTPNDPDDQYFRGIYRNFYNSYKLGPQDQIVLRVQGQPDYSLDQATVSPIGRIYHPLLGEVDVAGLTVPKMTEKLTIELSQYIVDPRVSVSLLTANSAKIGVLGDVIHPGIVVMARPMSILDAISASGGVSDSGSKSTVTVLRQMGEGRMQTMKVNVKRILEGKAGPEDNISLQAGDTVIVHGNTRKRISAIASMLGFGNFLWFIRSF
jgi:polysaccharide export outer membrane protein